jgi:TolB-like protein
MGLRVTQLALPNVNKHSLLCKKYIYFPFLLLALAKAAFALNNVAVLELLPNESVMENIRIEESRHLTDELRRQAVMNLPKGEYSVLTRNNIIALMPPDEAEAECLAEGCAVDIGRAIGAEYITQGTIGMFGSKLTISVELYETMGGKLLYSIVFESANIDGLLAAIRSHAKPLFQSIADSRPSPSAIPPPGQATPAPGEAPKPEASVSGGGFGVPQWVGIGLAAAGIGMGIYGFLQNNEYKSLHGDYMEASGSGIEASWKKAEDARKRRNIGYAVGAALFAGGITVYFAF